jgi:predicted transcriptional regulator
MAQHPDPAFTAREIADEFEKTRQWADNRLKQMESDSYLHSKNPGGRARFYWISHEGKERLRDERSN